MSQPDICESIISEYLASLEGEFNIEPNSLGCSIITPFIRPDGDYIEILAEQRPSGVIALSDMGGTFSYLHLSGLSLSRRLRDDAKRIGSRYDISVHVNELIAQVDPLGVGQALHNLVQAILAIASLVEKRRPYLNLRFDEEVEATIISQGKRYDPEFVVNGKKEHHTVRFHIDSGLNLLVQPFSQASEIQARRVAERWYYYFDDILKADPAWVCVAVLDDRGNRESIWSNPYTVRPLDGIAHLVKWSEKDKLVATLDGQALA